MCDDIINIIDLIRNSCVAVLGVILRITPIPPNMWKEKNYAEISVSVYSNYNLFQHKFKIFELG